MITVCFRGEDVTRAGVDLQPLPGESVIKVPEEDCGWVISKPEEYKVVDNKFQERETAEIDGLHLRALKKKQKEKVKADFLRIPAKGMISASLGVKIDSGREDKDNFRELLDYCNRLSLTETDLRLYDNSFIKVTPAQLQVVIEELQEFGLGLYQKKWAKEAAIDQAADKAAVKAITWESVE